MKLQDGLRKVPMLLGLIALVALLGMAAATLPIQLSVCTIMLAVALVLGSRERVLILAGSVVPVIGLIRRLLSDSSGYTNADPLVLLPLGLVVFGMCFGPIRPEKPVGAGRLISGGALMVVISTTVTIALRTAFDIQSLYVALSLLVPVLMIVGVATSRMPDVWPQIERILIPLALSCGAYGIVQFFVLPTWDKAWMITSKLQSIGSPSPMALRVFGTSESPGPFSAMIGLAIVILLCRLVVERRFAIQVAWFVGCAFLSIPLLLSGVRVTLVAVLACAVVLIVVRGKGFGRILPMGLVLLMGALLSRILDSVAGTSAILNSSRYTEFNLSTDHSFQSRLGLLGFLKNPLQYVIGTPDNAALDNLSIAIMVGYGLIAAIGISLIFVVITILALRNLVRRVGEVASACAIFISIVSFSGNPFNSSFGILIGFVFGSVYAAHRRSTSADKHEFSVSGKENMLMQAPRSSRTFRA